jgi:hypothetical protein
MPQIRSRLIALLLSTMSLSAATYELVVTTTATDAHLAPVVGAPALSGMLGVAMQYKRGEADLLADIDQVFRDGYTYVRVDWARDWIGNDFSKMDPIVALTQRYPGKSVLFTVHDWSIGAPDTLAEQVPFKAYLEALHEYHRSHPVRFEIWNEANYEPMWPGATPSGATYRGLLNQCLSGVDASATRWQQPSLGVCSTGMIFNCWNQTQDETYLRAMLSTGGAVSSRLSAIGVHPYFWSQGWEPERRIANHQGFVAARNAAGCNLPFWVTEIGYPSTIFDSYGNVVIGSNGFEVVQNMRGNRSVAQQRQAIWNVRTALIEWGLGTPLCCFYTFKNAMTNGSYYSSRSREDNFGLYDSSRVIKPAGLALRTAMTMTNGLPLLGWYSFPTSAENLCALKFGNATQTRYAVWVGRRGRAVVLTLQVPANRSLSRCDYNGAVSANWPASASAQAISQTISEDSGPVYFICN